MDLSRGIKTPSELLEAIEIAKLKDERYQAAILAIHKYKWYNWYQNIYIKQDTPEDIENTDIFNKLQETNPEIHEAVEANITSEINKLVEDID